MPPSFSCMLSNLGTTKAAAAQGHWELFFSEHKAGQTFLKSWPWVKGAPQYDAAIIIAPGYSWLKIMPYST